MNETYDESSDFDSDDEIPVSKSAIKRELIELQSLGECLAEMNPQKWEQFSLSDRMLVALEESRQITSHGAKRRHVRRLGKLLRDEDVDAVRACLDRTDEKHSQETSHFHQLERWRERLIVGGDEALNALIEDYPTANRQQIRQLVRQINKERETKKEPRNYRKLFQYLKGLENL